MYHITRRFEFDAGHRIHGHESKCAHLHGHRYVANVSVIAPELDSLGRVVDFSVVKELVGSWIDREWDHNLLLCPNDPLAKIWLNGGVREGISDVVFNQIFTRVPYIMPEQMNPTAENMARVLMLEADSLLQNSSGLRVAKVRLYETPNCWADQVNHTAF